MSFVQASTISGAIIEKARWEVQSLSNVQAGDVMTVCLNSEDKNLLTHIRKQAKTECYLDKSDDGRSSIVATFVVKQIRHMIDGQSFETMCIVTPASRHVEQIVLFLLDPEKCDRRFVEAVHGRRAG